MTDLRSTFDVVPVLVAMPLAGTAVAAAPLTRALASRAHRGGAADHVHQAGGPAGHRI